MARTNSVIINHIGGVLG